MKRPRVVVTGLGVVSSVGIGWRAFWDSLIAGRSGITQLSYVNAMDFPTKFGGEIHNFNPLDFMTNEEANQLGRGAQLAIAATKLALKDVREFPADSTSLRIGVCLGTTMADIQSLEQINETWVKQGAGHIDRSLITRYPAFTLSAHVARHFGFNGPNMMIPTACAAGNYAIGYAYDLLRLGKADIMIAGGVEPFSRTVFEGFSRIFAVAPERCQPFDKNRKGMIPGEGAGIVVLQRLEDLGGESKNRYAEILGYGISCDASHMTIPSSDGVEAVMVSALRDAGLESNDVDYINAHGTGTPANDRTECAAIRSVFGSHTDQMPISSVKSMIGHTMGAASALETIACCLTVKFDQLTPTINFETPDPECNADCVPNIARKANVRIAIKNAFAFGGNNASLVIGKYDGIG